MASYASIEDAIALYGTEYVTLSCDRDRDGLPDTDVMESALLSASDQIDGFIIGREPLPLNPVPVVLKKICVDIAIYDCCPSQQSLTEQKTKRYEAAMRYMEKIGLGKLRLSAAGVGVGANQSQTSTTNTACTNSVLASPGSRRMSRGQMRDI